MQSLGEMSLRMELPHEWGTRPVDDAHAKPSNPAVPTPHQAQQPAIHTAPNATAMSGQPATTGTPHDMSYVPTPGAHTLSPPSAHPPAPEAPAAIGHTSAHHPAAPTTAGGLPLLVDHSLVSVHQRPPASHNAPHAPPAHPQAAPPQPAHVGLHGVPPSLTSTPAPSVPQGPPVVPPLSIPRGSEHVPQVLPQEGGAHAPPEVKSSEYVQRIGSLLDEMSSTVSGACEQFQSGQFHSSSERLGHVCLLYTSDAADE